MDYFNKMDGASGYVRASLLGIGGAGLSQLHDPLRLHPALHSAVQFLSRDPQLQVSEANKEVGAMLRPISEYPHGLPLLPFAASNFFPHSLDPRLPFSPSAFHPLQHKPVSSAALSLSTTPTMTCSGPGIHGSAFSPLPAKCPKLEVDSTNIPSSVTSGNIFSHSMLAGNIDVRTAFLGGLSPQGISSTGLVEERRDSPSPRGSHGSRDSPGHARDADTPNSSGDDNGARKPRPGEAWCPVCGVIIRPNEFESHINFELDKLGQMMAERSVVSQSTSSQTSLHGGPTSPVVTGRGKEPGWDTYERVRSNRLSRARTKRKRAGRPEEVVCPLCSDRLGPNEDLSQHMMEHCLRKQSIPQLNNRIYMHPGVSRGEGGLNPHYLGVGGGVGGGAGGGGEDEVVDVEGDGPMEDYDWPEGRPAPARGALRPLHAAHDPEREKEAENKPGDKAQPRADERGDVAALERTMEQEREIDQLKEKIRVLERNNNGDAENKNSSKGFNCQVCRNACVRPTVSAVCWHVLCQACWANSLGVKTECPLCSQTMATDDLHPIQL